MLFYSGIIESIKEKLSCVIGLFYLYLSLVIQSETSGNVIFVHKNLKFSIVTENNSRKSHHCYECQLHMRNAIQEWSLIGQISACFIK